MVLGALGSVTKKFKKYVDKIGINKAVLSGTARILIKVLEC